MKRKTRFTLEYFQYLVLITQICLPVSINTSHAKKEEKEVGLPNIVQLKTVECEYQNSEQVVSWSFLSANSLVWEHLGQGSTNILGL